MGIVQEVADGNASITEGSHDFGEVTGRVRVSLNRPRLPDIYYCILYILLERP